MLMMVQLIVQKKYLINIELVLIKGLFLLIIIVADPIQGIKLFLITPLIGFYF